MRNVGVTSGFLACQLVRRLNQTVDDPGFSCAVPRIVNNPKVGFGPGLFQLPRGDRRSADVVAALDDDTRNASEPVDVLQQLRLFEEEILEEELGADAGKGNGLGRIGKTVEQGGIGKKCGDGSFPQRPFPCRGKARVFVIAGQTLVIGLHEVAAFGFWNEAGEVVPLFGHYFAGAVGIEPVLFLLPAEEHAAQYELAYPLGIFLGVGEGKGGAPATAESLPFFMPAHFAQTFDIFDYAPGIVVFDFSERKRFAAAALVEQKHVVKFGVPLAAMGRRHPATRTTVKEDGRFRPLGADTFPIE